VAKGQVTVRIALLIALVAFVVGVLAGVVGRAISLL